MAKKENSHNGELESVGQVLSTTEQFIEENQKSILIGVGAVILIVVGVLLFNNYYLRPREIAAEKAMYQAQNFFALDSFALALDGNGADVEGFKEIASNYSSTASGNLALAYSGICYYKMGDYENAIKSLSNYDGDDTYFKTSVIGLIGDANVELGKMDKAQSYYQKAIDRDNELSSVYLKKSGILYELNGDKESALEQYQAIKDDYPNSIEARDIDKYIERVKV